MFDALKERFIPGGKPRSFNSSFVSWIGSSRFFLLCERPDFCLELDFPLATDLSDPCDLKRVPISARPKMGSLKEVTNWAKKAQETM